MQDKHFCKGCGMTQPERKWWYYLIDDGIKKKDRKLLVDMILFYKEKNLKQEKKD